MNFTPELLMTMFINIVFSVYTISRISINLISRLVVLETRIELMLKKLGMD